MLPEVPSARAAIGRDAERTQLLLVPLCVRPGREQQDDLPRSGVAGGDEIADTPCDRTRLAAPPVHVGFGVGRFIGDEQLHRSTEDGVREVARRCQRLKLVAEVGAEEVVDDREHLGA